MEVNISKACKPLNKVVNSLLNDEAFSRASRGLSLEIGPASDDKYAVPAHAQDAVFVGDSARLLDPIVTPEVAALYKSHPEKVHIAPTYDSATKAWAYKFTKDSVDFLAGQQFLPWNVTYFKRIFKEPLTYTHAFDMVKKEQGSNPWAEIMSLVLEQYAGFASIGSTGSMQNMMTNDVNVINGMMSANVINMFVTYTLTQEEKERKAGQGTNPFGESSMVTKQRYANYVLNMLKAYLIYYGNFETQTTGLLNVNPVSVWGGETLSALSSDTTVTAKGNRAYTYLAKIINEFLTRADNKFSKVKIAMCPQAYNALTSMTYSDVYDPTSAMQIFSKNYLGGKGKDGKDPIIEFVSDPLLKPNTMFNETSADYMVITAPEIGAGPDDTVQPLVLYGTPLDQYVFPAIPGMYNTQFKTLSRVAGIFAPVPEAVEVIQGFGQQ